MKKIFAHFQSLFTKKQQTSLYLSFEREKAFFYTDIFFKKQKRKQQKLTIQLFFRKHIEKNKEADLISMVESELENTLGQKYQASFVSRISTLGKVNLYFYAQDFRDASSFVSEVLSHFGVFDFGYSIEADIGHKYYTYSLCPTEEEIGNIVLRKKIEHYRNKKKIKNTPQPLYFVCFLKDIYEEKDFLADLKNKGFSLLTSKQTRSFFYKKRVTIKKEGKVNFESLQNDINFLQMKLKKYKGKFEKWYL